MEFNKTVDLLWKVVDAASDIDDKHFRKTLNDFCEMLKLEDMVILEMNNKPVELFRRGFFGTSFTENDFMRIKKALNGNRYHKEKISEQYSGLYAPIGSKSLLGLILVRLNKENSKDSKHIIQNIKWLSQALFHGITNSNEYLLKMNERVHQIEEIKRHLERMIDSIPVPISIHDENHNIIRANKSLAEALNVQYKDLIGKKCYEMMHPGKRIPVQCPLATAKSQNKEISVENKDDYPFKGYFVTTVKKIPDVVGDAKLFIHSIQDISNAKELTKEVIRAVETERKALSSEIHDDLLQAGFSAMTHCNGVYQKIRDKQNRKRLELAIKSLEGLLSTGRKIIKELRPPLLETVGLIPAIKEHAKNIFDGYPIIVNIEPKSVKLSPELETTIFRIVQESLMNVLKHSKATEVKISIGKKQDTIEVVIIDNGIGLPEMFQSDYLKENIGMKLMKERTEMHHGCFCVTSRPGKGTKIKAKFPVGILQKVTQESCS